MQQNPTTNEAYDVLNAHYSVYDEDARFDARHNAVEFETTKRYIERFLTPDCRILEIGAGTGRYSHHFARMGYAVDAVELVPHNVDVFRARTEPGERVTIRQGSATDLGDFADDSYDITLLLGPMYHLFTEEERVRAIAEAVRVTKPDGILAVAYCMNEATVLHYGFRRGNIRDVLQKGMLDPVSFQCKSKPEDLFVLSRTEDIFARTARFPLTRLHFVATDLFTNHFRDMIAAMDEETFALWMQYHLTICERADLVGASHHTLDILQKERI